MYEDQILKKLNLEAILVNKPENVRHLTNFVGTFGHAIITPKQNYLLTDSRYKLEAEKIAYPEIKIIIIEDYFEDLKKILKKHKVKNLGIEDKFLTLSGFKNLKKNLKGTKLKPVKSELDLTRIIKTPEEIRLIRKSQIINEKTLKEALKFLKRSGIREKELAWKIIQISRDLGAEGISFDPIVAFGKNSASPHYTPDTKKYKKGEVVLIDMGMIYRGYCSDMTRTFLPKSGNGHLFQHYEIVLEAQKNTIEKLKPGNTGVQGDKYARSVIEKYGYAENFTHANGHGVGLEIHEAPSLSSKAKHKDKNLKIAEDMVVTVEPGIYLEGKYGIRIEDMIQIQSPENINLTKFPKEIKDVLI